jgi:hypothetical protein
MREYKQNPAFGNIEQILEPGGITNYFCFEKELQNDSFEYEKDVETIRVQSSSFCSIILCR